MINRKPEVRFRVVRDSTRKVMRSKIMKEYKKNQETKDEIFENRKQTIINNTAALSETDNDIEVVNKDMNNLNTVFETDDPWTEKNKNE